MNSPQWNPNFRRPAPPAVDTMMPPLSTLSGSDVYVPFPMPVPGGHRGHGGYRMLYVEAQDGYGPPPAAWLPPPPAVPASQEPAPGAGSGGMSLRTAAFIFGMLLGIVIFAIL